MLLPIYNQKVNPSMNGRKAVHITVMAQSFEPGYHFNGILAALYNQYGKDIFNNGALEIQVRLPCGPADSLIPLITGFPEGKYIGTQDDSRGAYIFDFQAKKVMLTGYILKTHRPNTMGHHWPTHWIVEGSNDSINYETLHEVQGCENLKGWNTYSLQLFQESTAFRFIRVRLTQPTASGKWHFVLGRIEFFGTLVDEQQANTEE
jgi:hypothetical protein